MRLKPVLSVLGVLLAATGAAMTAAVVVGLLSGESDLQGLLVSAMVSIGIGLLLHAAAKGSREELSLREGFAIVTLGWILVPVFGSFPFILSGAIPSFTDAYFEAVSGFTTTGASILIDVEALPKSLLFWRSMTQWFGGTGIILLSLAILPMLGIAAMQLYRAEVAGPIKDKLTPRVASTARLLWGVYVLLTGAEVVLLVVGGMPLFDAVCHAFTTISTGGFSTKNTSIGFYGSAYIDGVVTVFMMVSAMNFSLHYAALKGNASSYGRSEELLYFLSSFMIALVVITLVNLLHQQQWDAWEAFRFSAFNLASVMTCTGFATADFALWAPVSQLLLLFLMFPGGCAGSTAGGMKNIRVLIMFKSVASEIRQLARPNLVSPVRIDGKAVETNVLTTSGAFVLLYITVFLASSIILTHTGLDLISAASAVASCMAAVGPGLGSVGPMSNYAHLTGAAKWVLDACMILGRLELFTVIVVFSPTFWRR